MICFLYDLVFLFFALLAFPRFVFRLRQAKDPFCLLRERWGFLSDEVCAKLDGRAVVWVHAVSVGEVLGVKRLLERAMEKFPQFQFVLSVTTPTGYSIAQEKVMGVPLFYAPFDISWATRRVLHKLNPRTLLLMETEIWPNLILACADRGVKIGLINGRLSPKSFRRYFSIRALLRPLLELISFFAVQTEQDRERFQALGAQSERVFLTGNLKFDDVTEEIAVNPAALREKLNIPQDARIFLAGSTHPGEEEFLLDVQTELLRKHSRLFLILAPRHAERADCVLSLTKRANLGAGLFSKPVTGKQVLVVDVMGKLRELYAIADVVFMGGSLIRHGGQNPVEAIRFARGVISGPFVFNFQQIFDILRENGAAQIVHSREELIRAADELLSDAVKRREMGEKARQVVLNLRGATEKHLKLFELHLNLPLNRPAEREEGATNICRNLEKLYLRILSGDTAGPVGAIFGAILALLSYLYTAVVLAIRRLYGKQILKVKRLSISVVSVGNLTWGGTGKTPLVDYVAEHIESAGKRVFILTRGYGSDEIKELARGHPAAKVVVGKDRYAAARKALENSKADIAILDDGFQHWRLFRDLDIVAVNALNPFGNGNVIPAGILREPVSAVRYADFVVITHTNLVERTVLDQLVGRLRRNGIRDEQIAESVHEPQYLYRASSGKRVLPGELGSKQALAFSGIGHPASFESTLKGAGVKLSRSIRFQDHHSYSGDELRSIKSEALAVDELITTEKDFLRSPELMIDIIDPLVLKIRIRITKGEKVLHARLDSILRR
ncbi:MAG: tetraacyldisaccharide 4'-kinase [Candidatus Omnitrophica bacterium]|nr:tetraacyldisaccharide 4'-kinase [Candidatus Omnitrophota bacterium]